MSDRKSLFENYFIEQFFILKNKKNRKIYLTTKNCFLFYVFKKTSFNCFMLFFFIIFKKNNYTKKNRMIKNKILNIKIIFKAYLKILKID